MATAEATTGSERSKYAAPVWTHKSSTFKGDGPGQDAAVLQPCRWADERQQTHRIRTTTTTHPTCAFTIMGSWPRNITPRRTKTTIPCRRSVGATWGLSV
ncbi:hypothetical protein MGG_05016 [Pyricularia oryzae 70-15]|uniref:Uncharacterized protein n=1 Tax=Pyricularia oryzae (strain 70-15 / ATCC MYA-4617 / FGSC 8958) TaxID=242507 RepID=G4N3U2_PYRO7|nr:uncharacterized protein MGG_05016 [Pyricularia oryzae 70-15]EHA52715.1 hypothetical protein MGG_05016 [Pyricularia oryzae 70-15]